MTLELLQWISPAVIIGVMLHLHRLNRQDIKGLRGEITDFRNHVDAGHGNLRNHVDASLADLRNHVDAGLAELRSHIDTGLAELRSHVDTGLSDLRNRLARLEGTLDVLEREAPGLAEAMRAISPFGRLSRGRAGAVGAALVLNLPGSPTGAVEQLDAVLDVIGHALDLLAGTDRTH